MVHFPQILVWLTGVRGGLAKNKTENRIWKISDNSELSIRRHGYGPS